MADIEDLVEALVDIEGVVEEVGEPTELVEDLVNNPFMILFGLLAGFGGVISLLLLALTLTSWLLSVGPLWILTALTIFMFLLVLVAIGGFLYVRTSIPDSVQQRIDDALARADDTPQETEAMTEQEAIDELKDLYATGELRDHELDQALDDVLTSDNPERVIERYQQSEATV
jgi:hypothetical protein